MMTNDQKNKLKRILISISDEAELEALKTVETAGVSAGIEDLSSKIEKLSNSSSKELQQIAASLSESLKKAKSDTSQLVKIFADLQKESSERVVEAISNMGNTISTSYEKNKPFNAAGVYKDMVNQLSSIDQSIKDKPVPVWNWPQYASVGVRDTNFRNVNPSIAGFNITSPYDYISLTYTGSNITTVNYRTGGAAGTIVATLSLAYSGSNITSVTRTA